MVQCVYPINRDSTGTGTGTVPGRNNIASLWSQNICFLFRSGIMQSIFTRYLAYNITTLQTID